VIAGLPLAFTSPLILLGLLALPVLWWLLRLVPPTPRRIAFPPTRILFEIEPKEETPARTPWWLTLLRLVLAALIIIFAAGPLWNPQAAGTTGGPVALVIDSGWAAATTWDGRIAAAEAIVNRAEAAGQGVAVLATGAPPKEVSLLRPGEAREALRLLKPAPHTPDRNELISPLTRFMQSVSDASIVWLADNIDLGDGEAFVAALDLLAPNRVSVLAGGLPGARAIAGADNAASGLSVRVMRAEESAPAQGAVRAYDLRGLSLGDAPFSFAAGATETEARFDLPVEIRNEIARLGIAGERSAGAVELLDKRWRRRTVGVVSGSTADTAQPLLASTYYLSRALGPFADVVLAEGTAPAVAVERFIDQRLPVIVLADIGNIVGNARTRLERWLQEGGVLIRFAGPRLAAAEDTLVPVRLRRGGRTLGGSLSWEQPQKLGSFAADGPFGELKVPDDVTVQRQVLAEPDGTLAERTWASLADGTPLVTANVRGRGMVVLFHVTADTAWSNLPISGSFVEMLRRVIAQAGSGASSAAKGAAATQTERGPAPTIAPARLLDGFGNFTAPGPTARPIPADFTGPAVADHPPGFYGPPEGLVAVNALAPDARLNPLRLGPLQNRAESYSQGEPVDLRPGVLMGVFSLLLLDALIVFLLAGGIARLLHRRAAAVLVLAVLLPTLGNGELRAQSPKQMTQAQMNFALQATLQTRFAYVRTGNSEVDTMSHAGLDGLALFMSQRTALEPGEPMAVDITQDELSFFPFLYWPVLADAARPDTTTLGRIDAYMKQGGTVIFDTRDSLAMNRPNELSPAGAKLREILTGLDIPELEPVPADHVLTKSFYLLRDFPGRFAAGTLWVEALPAETEEIADRPARAGDGVSQILITSNDFAGAWAIGTDGQPLLPLTPGEPRQREFAFRVGVNIVMYVLTGNYKADQVHVPALLERLGQ
jgi:hypothetical protein